jgi:hypothetical protein
VIKHVIKDDGGTAVAGDFTMNVAGPTPLSFAGEESPGTTKGVVPGAYTVTETGPAGYTLTYSGDCNASGQVTLALGQTKTCTLTNDDQPPPPGYGDHDPGDVDPGDPYGQDPVDDKVVDPYVPAPTTTTTTTTVGDPNAGVAGETTPLNPVSDQPQVLGETGQPAPSTPGGFLPRTGAGIMGEGVLALLLVGSGLVLMWSARRRRTQPSAR